MKIGDRVALKSGGPEMTVIDPNYGSNLVQCGWFNRDGTSYLYVKEVFPKDALSPVK